MDGASMNRYEKQLYTVFKTFDVDNEEALDKSAVHQLCDALQLEDRGAALVDTLFERCSDRVTFAQFRNGLLAVLGGEGGEAPGGALDQPAQHSDDDSSGREVAPKFVFGSKKYGRRSRPVRASAADEPASPRSSSASRLDSDDRRARQRARCRRSASAMESRDDGAREDRIDAEAAVSAFGHDRRIDRDEALALCRGLSMDRIDRRLVERIFEDSGSADTTVGEFFDRLNASLTTTMEEVGREAGAPASPPDRAGDAGDGVSSAGVAADLVLEAWERAGVRRPRRLLAELGFVAPALRPPDLERALDDELRALPEPLDERRDARAVLLVAALALNRLRLESARRRSDAAAAERDKLRADVAEANRRAGLLAQEVDESHARLESELRASLRRAEARHAEASRLAAEEAAAERERAAADRARFEGELARRAEAEARGRSEAAAARARGDRLEARALAAEGRLAEAERERARLATELRAARASGAGADEAGEAAGAAGAARLDELRRENEALRDRNDELCAELEARQRARASRDSADPPRGDLSAEFHSLPSRDRPEDCDRRILGRAGAVATLREMFDSIDEIPACEAGCRSCASFADVFRTMREKVRDSSESPTFVEGPPPRTAADAAAQTDSAVEAIAPSERLEEVERTHREEKGKLADLVRDLENSLEQMKTEYDKCEEYWADKLEEEREAYAEEQRLGDERLADLVAKIGEYERRFAAGAALPAIDERRGLEAQFTDLEDEFARYRAEREAELAARAADAARLAERVRALEAAAAADARRRPRDYHNPAYGDGPPEPAPSAGEGAPGRVSSVACACRVQRAACGAAGAGEVRELRARTARAEAAARRLHARLAAADLLVKDLYVENCQLAQRRPL